MTTKGKPSLTMIPTFDDMGRLVAINDVPLNNPANAMSLMLAQRGAASTRDPLMKAQNNQMDEAYNNTAFVKSPGTVFSPETTNRILEKRQKDRQDQDLLLKLFGLR